MLGFAVCCVLCDYKEGPRDLWASIMEMEMETETKARHVSEEIIRESSWERNRTLR